MIGRLGQIVRIAALIAGVLLTFSATAHAHTADDSAVEAPCGVCHVVDAYTTVPTSAQACTFPAHISPVIHAPTLSFFRASIVTTRGPRAPPSSH